jgi:glucan phosphoethanolaminetransferase (alkaline phosphatase superfamily)
MAWRFSRRDAILVTLTVLHAAILIVWPLAPVIALGVWWNSNTIAHNFIHRPFFRSAGINRLFSAALSVLLGIPQTLWRDRHLAHHAGVPWRLRISTRLAFETALVVCLWSCMAARHPRFFLFTYLPGYLVGLCLCALQGHWEHAVGRPTSHYGRIYNFLCFNDGYHAEHHADPAVHWTSLPCRIESGAATSDWPPLLRWLEMAPLESLERVVLRSSRLQRFVLRRHRKAFQSLLPQLPIIRQVTIVGGGLFPRTALILRELLPAAHLTIVDSNPRNLETARAFLDGNIEFRTERYVPGESRDCDLTVIPMCLDGDRAAIYRHPPSSAVLVHDWIWHPHGSGAVVSVALLKRLNLVCQTPIRAATVRERFFLLLPAALFLVFLVAKMAMVWGHAAPLSAWSLVAYTWQDAMVALAFAAFVILLQNRIAWLTYWAVAIYTAINIPVARVVFTPLTRPMLRAARGPLADSMLRYATAANVMLILSVLAAAAALPLLLSRAPRPLSKLAILCLLPFLFLGPMASRRVDTRGMDRNAITALLGSSVPRATHSPAWNDWRASPFPSGRAAEDLSRYAGAARGFNVVMISLESTAAQYLALYGARSDPMPNLSLLARRALVFENAYAAYPESIKGLFSVLCSTFPAFDSRPEAYEKAACRSLADVLADADYRTAMFHSGRFGYLGMESIIRHRGYQTLEDAGSISGNYNSSFGVDEPATVARMLAWIDALPRTQPFFLTYLPIAGHHPYATPQSGPFTGTAEIDQYRNALHYGDASLGVLIEGLRARGLENNTIWVIYGDHGEAFDQHQGNYGHTFFLYDENIHVPFLIAAPGLMHQPERVRKVVGLVDTAPTILALTGIPPPPNYQGRTMLDSTPRMALFFADYSLGLLGLRDGPWKFIYEIESGRAKLFDLDRDPRELSDLAPREPARASQYGRLVRNWCGTQKSYIARAAMPE